MRIYLDNNATTAIHPAALEAVADALRLGPGNASSVHREGQAARRLLEESRDAIASHLAATPREIVFTGGGSESNNTAIFGLVGRGNLSHIVTTSIEHPSVSEPIRELEARGCAVTRVGCGPDGAVDADAMIAALRDETTLVAMILAHNETGVIQPVERIGAEARARGIAVHVDAVQALGKMPLHVSDLNADTVSFSAHKLHGPPGIGALWIRTGRSLDPLVRGGAQERRRRAGTEPVALAAGFATAVGAIDFEEIERVRALRERFERRLFEAVPAARVNGRDAKRLPNTSNLVCPGGDGEAIQIALDLRGIAISTGSACSSGRVEPSRVLLAMGLSVEDAKSSIRISLGRTNTEEEIDRALAALVEVIGIQTARAATAAGERGRGPSE
ncbi:MAG: cysteine desulfurase [Acidobacteria bacterium]|nr:cysteine desulfurase [Acidobacteriota bacterium]